MKSKNDGMVSMENQFEEENRIVAERKEKLKKHSPTQRLSL